MNKIKFELCNKAIVITGSARSGTTILGKILHSFNNVEYTFEPPLLISLFTLIEKLNEEDWKLLYETYLYEDFLITSLSGRNFNFNTSDDSCIFNAKKKSFVENRLSKSLRKHEAVRIVEKYQIVWKIPSIPIYINRLIRYYPKTKVIYVKRSISDTMNSLLKKQWFNNNTLKNNNLNWPNNNYKGLIVPFWVKKNDSKKWINMTEIDRCAYYILRMNDFTHNKNFIYIEYEDLIKGPFDAILKLSKSLGLEWGAKTKEILNTVKINPIKRDDNILQKISKSLRLKLELDIHLNN